MTVAARSFEDLEIWQRAHAWVLVIYALTAKFPREELFGLASQLRRAAVSVPANIAEGFGKQGRLDKARYYNIAQGSLNECRYYFILACDLGYGETCGLLEEQDQLSRMLRTYISKVRTSNF